MSGSAPSALGAIHLLCAADVLRNEAAEMHDCSSATMLGSVAVALEALANGQRSVMRDALHEAAVCWVRR
jgi:hypothetical protein